jgi:hypothetical protein
MKWKQLSTLWINGGLPAFADEPWCYQDAEEYHYIKVASKSFENEA